MLHLPMEQANQLLQTMTPAQKIGQLMMASIEVTEMDDATRAFLRENKVGNIILFGKNCENRGQIARLNQQLQEEIIRNTGAQALISIDQEGGPVLRIRKGASTFPCAMAIGASGDPLNAYLTGLMEGEELRALGICFDLAPVLDVNGDDGDPIVGRRSYGAAGEQTALYGGAFARGLREMGVIDCGKHYPGEGFTRIDTHFAFAVDETPAERVETELLAPFKQVMAEGLRAIMTTHVCYPALEPNGYPATMSSAILQEMTRKRMGFEGLIISDGMQMDATAKTYGAPRGCVMAIKAGCDLVITGNGGDNASPEGLSVQTPCYQALLSALESGELPMERVNEAARRILAFKLLLGDMRPAPDVETQNWTAHEAFFKALAKAAVTVHQDREHLLPIGPNALFVCEKPRSRFGVEEGDKLLQGFARLAAGQLNGVALEYENQPDMERIRTLAQKAQAVVFGTASPAALEGLIPAVRAVQSAGKPVALVCLDAPYLARQAQEFPCVLSCYDQTPQAISCVCEVLCGKG